MFFNSHIAELSFLEVFLDYQVKKNCIRMRSQAKTDTAAVLQRILTLYLNLPYIKSIKTNHSVIKMFISYTIFSIRQKYE